ncbi:MAG: GNAT family N-acetyltransferase, partial [Ruthenibacterium sp.]
MGVWEQKTWGEIGNDYPEQLTNFTRRMDQWQVEGAESAAIVRDRMLGAIRAIAAENEGKTVAAFSHGCALRILLGTLEGYSLAQLGDTAHGDNTAVSLLEIADDKIRVVFRDDNAHVTETSAFSSQDWWSRPNGIQPGLYFRPADEKTDAQLLAAAGASGTEKPTLCALLEGKAIGILQLDPTREEGTGCGWLTAYYIAPDFRQRGYGIQLLGQAVQFYRPRERLRLALPEGAAA